MDIVALTNVPRTNIPKRGRDRGPDVYPFFDPAYTERVARLVVPARDQVRNTAPIPSFRQRIPAHTPRSHVALADCWATTTVTTFEPVGEQRLRWPFTTTTVIERDPETYPTDLGLLDAEDLGEEVAAVLTDVDNGRISPVDDPVQRNVEAVDVETSSSLTVPALSSPTEPASTSSTRLDDRVRPLVIDLTMSSPPASRHFDPVSSSPSLRAVDTVSSLPSPSSSFIVGSPTSSFDAASYFPSPTSSVQEVVVNLPRSSSSTGSIYSPSSHSDMSTSPSPAPSVPSVIVISDDEDDTARPRVDAVEGLPPAEAAPATARPSATAPRPASSVKKPEIGNYRSRKYRIVVPPALRKVIRDWRASARIVKNEAIRLVNTVDSHAHEYLKERSMYKLLVTNSSDFVRERPFLKQCPTYIRRQVVQEAISARKGLITQHFNTPRSQRGPIPDISPSTARTDKRKGFSVALDPQSGSIDFEVAQPRAPRRTDNDTAATPGRHERRITSMTLKIAPRHVRRRGADPDVKICLRGQRQRQFLVDSCNLRHMGSHTGDKYQMPREWLVRCDRYGRWYLVVFHLVASEADLIASRQARKDRDGETTLEGPLRVKSCDPGVRTPYSIYSSEGQTIDIGDDTNKDRLSHLRLEMDELHSQRHKTRPMNRRPSRNISRKKRSKRKRYVFNSKERQELLGKQLRVSEKIRNLVTDLHARTANFHAVSSDVIVMPRMEVHRMISRKGSLAASTKRELKGWSHAKFLDRLARKCHDMQFDERYQRPRETVLLVQPEAYTSKMCGRCGVINERLGSNRVFECPNPGCGYVADRDHNGAFNMIVKANR